MKGTYCLVIQVPRTCEIEVGALGRREFPAGVYAYVGSALGGIEGRVGRHKRFNRRRHWHIDHLLERGEVIATVAIPSGSKGTECNVASSLLASGQAVPPVKGFGSSDCKCPSHLVYFGEKDPAEVAEILSMVLTMLQSVYPRTVGGGQAVHGRE